GGAVAEQDERLVAEQWCWYLGACEADSTRGGDLRRRRWSGYCGAQVVWLSRREKADQREERRPVPVRGRRVLGTPGTGAVARRCVTVEARRPVRRALAEVL
ncbi:hypothetical protein U1Q18_000345, partial [Sarracenia purpurea var. burkii]